MIFTKIATKTGWTIPEISNLTIKQLDLILDSLTQIEYDNKEWEASLVGIKLKTRKPERIYPPKKIKDEFIEKEKQMIENWIN